MEYLVEWKIELDADSPEEAANRARQIQLDPTNSATHFYVTAEDDDETLEVNAETESAAPDLLAACEEALALLDDQYRWTDEYKTLKAAIAKAKGAL